MYIHDSTGAVVYGPLDERWAFTVATRLADRMGESVHVSCTGQDGAQTVEIHPTQEGE